MELLEQVISVFERLECRSCITTNQLRDKQLLDAIGTDLMSALQSLEIDALLLDRGVFVHDVLVFTPEPGWPIMTLVFDQGPAVSVESLAKRILEFGGKEKDAVMEDEDLDVHRDSEECASPDVMVL
jgi:hypothetical protein